MRNTRTFLTCTIVDNALCDEADKIEAEFTKQAGNSPDTHFRYDPDSGEVTAWWPQTKQITETLRTALSTLKITALKFTNENE
ncbi:hypothetical protein JKY72_00210 [Candidatus Gracilibacteria bacterium]|nr:hypothetical protein [Candidatus Gracilibacteria bacterium]